MSKPKAKTLGVTQQRKTPVPKRTSIGRDHKPKNKHKRKSWKAYRGQGRA